MNGKEQTWVIPRPGYDVKYTVSIYPSVDVMTKMGYKSMYDMSDDLENVVRINYPGLLEEKYAMFDPESEGFMVYCTGEDVHDTIMNEWNEFVNSCGL